MNSMDWVLVDIGCATPSNCSIVVAVVDASSTVVEMVLVDVPVVSAHMAVLHELPVRDH